MENNLHSHSVKLVSVVWDVGNSRSAWMNEWKMSCESLCAAVKVEHEQDDD